MFAKRMIYPVQIGTPEGYLCLIFVLDDYEILLSQYKYPDGRYMYKYFFRVPSSVVLRQNSIFGSRSSNVEVWMIQMTLSLVGTAISNYV